MQIIPLKKQVIVKKLELPKPKTFIPADSTLLGEVCRIIDMGPDCRDAYKVGDVVVVLGGQIFTVPELELSWVHDDAILMTIQGYEEDGK